MFELYSTDETGMEYVAAAYSSAEEAKEMLELALEDARGMNEAYDIWCLLQQVYEELAYESDEVG